LRHRSLKDNVYNPYTRHRLRKLIRNNPKEFGNYTLDQLQEEIYTFFQNCGDALVYQPNGILLNGLGYFTFASFNKRLKDKADRVTLANNGLIYRAYVFTHVFRVSSMRGMCFIMDRDLKEKFQAHVVKGKTKYRVWLNTVKKLIGNGRTRLHYSTNPNL
jgi:hypothetical protein